ncbi:gp7 [Listeria phage P40]|uniref:head protein n=1 Tax=Listeria phage P40 TaxID=560178 RepID=UPI00018198BE|nr:head protein [Listeria phage P40]ACI00367.1 gp7 [Listeria phage P40]
MFLDLATVNQTLPNITQNDLDALELNIRAYTSNHFLNRASYVRGLDFKDANSVVVDDATNFRVGDSIEIWNSGMNDGLHVIQSIDDYTLTFNDPQFRDLSNIEHANLGLVQYPQDVLSGCMQLLEFDENGRPEFGVKQETVARTSMTYYDTTSLETRFSYPAFLTDFLTPYKRFPFGD